MIEAPLPLNESERQAALNSYQILDTECEAAFDDLTSLAVQIAGTPIALVSFVDGHRQWFKSRHGLSATETPREYAFCAHAILEAGPTVVQDSLADPRFVNNPLVTGEPHVRFYAGTPLVDRQGHALGTLCVLDHVPRVMSDSQLASLQMLGRQVMRLLEMRRARDVSSTAVTAKSDFILAHCKDMRASVNGIAKMAALLQQTLLSDAQHKSVASIQSCGGHLEKTLGVILDSAATRDQGPGVTTTSA